MSESGVAMLHGHFSQVHGGRWGIEEQMYELLRVCFDYVFLVGLFDWDGRLAKRHGWSAHCIIYELNVASAPVIRTTRIE